MDALSPSLTVLSAMITPAVLISACGTLILSTSNRLSRVIDRVETLSTRLNQPANPPSGSSPSFDGVAIVFTQLQDTARRVRFLQWALSTFYLAVGIFVANMVIIGLMALMDQDAIWATVGLALVGAGLMLAGCMLLIIESRLALETTYREMDYVRRLARSRVPPAILRRRRNPPSLLRRAWLKRPRRH